MRRWERTHISFQCYGYKPTLNLDHVSSSLSPIITASLLCTQSNKLKNAIKFLIHLSCHEEWNSRVARGHIHSLSPLIPQRRNWTAGSQVHRHVTLNKSRWLSDKHSHVRTLYFPGNPNASPPIQFSRCKSWNVVLRKKNMPLSLSLSLSILLSPAM